jgi:salicylate hydroxylase
LAPARNVIVAGAGIGGLTAALALARAGLRATVLEQAARLEETGAGIQLSPNATRILIELGVGERLKATVVAPQAIRVMSGGSAREIVRIPLGARAEKLYGAPFWVVHRGDLQAALADTARGNADIELRLGMRVEDFAVHAHGITVQSRRGAEITDERGIALIGADGLWSSVRARLGRERPPSFAWRSAWRALIPADAVPAEYREPMVHLWLGRDAHLVHYPVRGGSLINIVAIAHDERRMRGWSAPGERAELLRRFSRWDWADAPRALLGLPEQWLKWALYDRRKPHPGGDGPITLLGDAAHPMLPFLAQGAAMAIEDAAVLAVQLANNREDPAGALRAYEKARRARTAKAQHAARQQGRVYNRSGPEVLIRNFGMRMLGGEKLLTRYEWLYNWREPSFFSSPYE